MQHHKAAKAMHCNFERKKGPGSFTLRHGISEEESVIDIIDGIVGELHRIRDSALRMDMIVIVMLFEYIGQFLCIEGEQMIDNSDREYLLSNIREMYDDVEDFLEARIREYIDDTDDQEDGELCEEDYIDGELDDDEQSDDGIPERDSDLLIEILVDDHGKEDDDEPLCEEDYIDGELDDEPDDEDDAPTEEDGEAEMVLSLILQDDDFSKFLARLVRKAYDKGWNDGYDVGYEEGFEDAGNDIREDAFEEGYANAIGDFVNSIEESDGMEVFEDDEYDDDQEDDEQLCEEDYIDGELDDEPDVDGDGYGDDIDDPRGSKVRKLPRPCRECTGSCCARCYRGAVCVDLDPRSSDVGGA